MGLKDRLLSLSPEDFNAEVHRLLGEPANPAYVRNNLLQKTPAQIKALLAELSASNTQITIDRPLNHREPELLVFADTLFASHLHLAALASQLLAESNPQSN